MTKIKRAATGRCRARTWVEQVVPKSIPRQKRGAGDFESWDDRALGRRTLVVTFSASFEGSLSPDDRFSQERDNYFLSNLNAAVRCHRLSVLNFRRGHNITYRKDYPSLFTNLACLSFNPLYFMCHA